MSFRERVYERMAQVITRRPGTIIIACAVMTLLMLAAATRLSMKTQLAEMMPEDIPAIREFLDITEDYQSAENIMLTIESDARDVDRMKECGDDLASRLKSIVLHEPVEGTKLGLGQRIRHARGEFPLPGVAYDTLQLVRRVDYKVNSDFVSQHGMIIQKTSDLENTVEMFGSLELAGLIRNMNDNFEREFIEDTENLNTLDGEGQAVQGLEGMRRFLASIESYAQDADSAGAADAVADFVSGGQYFLSSDNTMLIMMLQPAVSFTRFEAAINLGEQIDDTLAAVRADYPDVVFSRTGSIMYQIDENKAFAQDFGWSYVVALGLILVLLMGSFRTWRNPFYSVLTLLVSLIWVSGALALVLHYLNMMSAGFGIVLIGLGIDFGIHFISGFRDGREQGMSPKESVVYMYRRVGAGVVTGAMTTAIVFFCLPLTGFSAYSQMGISMGTGIVVTLAAMMVLLPALIAWDNRHYSGAPRRMGLLGRFFSQPVFELATRPLQFEFLGAGGRAVSRLPVAIAVLVVSVVLAGLSVLAYPELEWEYDFMKLQPRGTESEMAQNKILDKFDLAADNALVRASDLAECRRLIEEFKKVGNRTGMIGQVDGITEFMPEPHVQQRNARLLEKFRDTLSATPLPGPMDSAAVAALSEELVRLHQNIVEIGELSIMGSGEDNKIIRKCDQMVGKSDEDSHVLALARKVGALTDTPSVLSGYQQVMGGVLKERLLMMSSPDIVTLEDLPEDIRIRYVNPNNNELLITVYPRGYIWTERALNKFLEATMAVDERVTGMPSIMVLLMDLITERGRIAVGAGAIAIIFFLMLDFRSLRYTFLAVVPLVVGSVWMLGLMSLFGVKLSMMTFMALPLIIGIGIDDGVHILHRYRIEGTGSVPMVMKFTGRAILLTSMTTMIGFGSMALGIHRGLAALGLTLFYGVGACFLSSAFMLPAMLTIMEKLQGKK